MIIDQDWRSVRLRYLFRSLSLSVPATLVGPYLVGLILGLEGKEIAFALGVILLPILLLVVGLQQWVICGALCKTALADNPEDRPGDRLRRILALPRKLELYGLTLAYGIGAPMFTFFAALAFGRAMWLVPVSLLIGVALAMVVGIPCTLLLQDDLKPVAVAELHRHPRTRAESAGFAWPRMGWYLPYAFSVMLFSVLISEIVVLGTTYGKVKDQVLAELESRGGKEVAALVTSYLRAFALDAGLPMLIICGVLLGFFIASGLLIARRQRMATRCLQDSLHSLAAGTPTLPDWAATDEVGDLAFGVALVSDDMRRVFAQLRAMAEGDLSVDLKGESGLIATFRSSQQSMRNLAERMRTLSEGDRTNAEGVAGELGKAFSSLSTALGATVLQAKTIAQGDLRQDVPLSGELGSAIQQMTKNLRAMVGQTQTVGAKIGDIVVSLRSATTQLSAATTEQVSALTETANTMTEMAQTSAASADRCADLIRQGQSAAEVVEEGRQGAHDATSAMNAISGALGKVTNASSILAEKVQRVDGIIDTVGFLADQSSTLAINASIEASRAGEAGKGFAAVAREIRSLANDSRKATAEIREILQEIRQHTVQVDTVVAAGSTTVDDGVRLVNRLGEVVSQLGVTLHEAVGLMRQVEGSARQHQAGVNQVSQALRSMQLAAESIRDGAHMLSELSEQEHQLSTALKATAGAYQLPGRAEASA